MHMQTKHLIPLLMGVILTAGLAFYGGTLYAKPKIGAFRNGMPANFRTGVGPAGANGPGRMMGLAAGEILSKDDKSVTVKLQDGGSKIVFFSASTTVSKMTDGSLDDLTQGTNVFVNGTTNADGSVTANMIQIRPEGVFPIRDRQGAPGIR